VVHNKGRLVETVLLLGLGPTALSALDSLAEEFNVVGVVRDTTPGNDEVANRAREFGIPLLTDISIVGVRKAITETRPACVVVSSYNKILPAELIAQGRFVNVHYAPLPEYRGRANVNWAIINGEHEAGISIHVLTAGLDAGNILYQYRIAIGSDDTVTDLYEKLNAIQASVLGETIKKYIEGYEGVPQDNSAATYGCGRLPEDGEIDWSSSTRHIYALVRALTKPYPAAFTYIGTRRMDILKAAPVLDAPRYVGRIPGRVIGRSAREGYVDVLTGDGVLRIHEVRFGDSTTRVASECITSTKLTLGLRIADLLTRLEALELRIKRSK
jgi:methionyl-tRNA formyltransferase